MTTNAFTLFSTIINSAWLLFTGWHVPGTNLTPAAYIFFCIMAALCLKFLKHLMTGHRSNDNNKE